ncbi:MAG: hypothetical protein GQ557_02360 [Mycoplasmataceae bacterium]|nr:hypothetical protein [Mycoplasmataceae bacterium]
MKGIYKLYFDQGDQYFPNPIYIGFSKNIEVRIKTHLKKIKSYYGYFTEYNNLTSKDFEWRGKLNKSKIDELSIALNFLKAKGLAAIDAVYIKIVSFMILNDYKITDLKWEVLEEIEKVEYENIHFASEQKYIRENNFECERLGFNGPNARTFTIEGYAKGHILSEKEKTLFGNQIKEISNNIQKWKLIEHSVVIDWNLKNENNYFQNWEKFWLEVVSKANFEGSNPNLKILFKPTNRPL